MLMHQLLIDGADRTPDRVALHWVDRARELTYAEAVAAMERAAGALAGFGVGHGDRVMIFAHNGLDYLVAMFGAWRLGAIAALVNVAYADQLEYYLGDADPRVVVYTGDKLDAIDRCRPSFPGVEHYICLDGPQPGAAVWDDLLESADPPPPDTTADDDVAHLSYTSGTSGAPKGVCLAHEPTMRATRCIAERLRIRPGEVTFGPTALSSSYQLVANLLPGLHRLATVCVMSRWTADAGWDALDARGANVLAANPTVLQDVLDESRRRGRTPSGLRVGVSGGGPVPPDLKRAWRDELDLPLAESYGQSELGGFVGLAPPEPPTDTRIGACGPPLPDKEVRIFDDDGLQVLPGVLGEIVIRGGFMAGYWRRPDKTAETLRDGWLHTGDLGTMDADGWVTMRGRLSERLTVAGRHWYPRDIEEALLAHRSVREAALIGLPDDTLGQRPIAYVTLVDDATAEELVAHAAAVCGIDLDVVITHALPMTPTGKISKAQLVEMARR